MFSAVSSSWNSNTIQPDLKEDIPRFLNQRKESDTKAVTTIKKSQEFLATEEKQHRSPPSFKVHPVVEENNNTENFIPLFSFLEERDYKTEFGSLYKLSSELLASSVFYGHSDEDELIAFLGSARETARKKRFFWSQTRLCFLLGKLCAGRSKFSQARVYLEESLCVPRESFTDLRLLASIYSNLVTIYLMQKNSESFFALVERLAALLMGIPECLESLEDNTALKYILKKSVLCHNRMAEARALHLLAKHHWTRDEGGKVVPYLERLLVLCAEAQIGWNVSPSHGYLTLGRLYSKLQFPHLSVSAARRASLESSATLSDCLSSIILVSDRLTKLGGITDQEVSIHPQIAPFLHQALSLTKMKDEGPDQYRVLSHHLTVSLCQLFCKHGMIEQAIHYMHTLINIHPHLQPFLLSAAERNSALIWLAWLHIDNKQPDIAVDILDSVLASLPEHCTTTQEGLLVLLNIVFMVKKSLCIYVFLARDTEVTIAHICFAFLHPHDPWIDKTEKKSIFQKIYSKVHHIVYTYILCFVMPTFGY